MWPRLRAAWDPPVRPPGPRCKPALTLPMSPDRTHAGQLFGDMVDTCAGSCRSGVPRSSGRKRIVGQTSLRVGRKATGKPRTALGSRGRRLWKDGTVPL